MSEQHITGNEPTTNTTVKEIFESSAAEVDALFTSFGQLYEIYTNAFGNLQKLPPLTTSIDQTVLSNTQAVFRRIEKTVAEKEQEISSQLYTQGVVLLIGNAESILRSMFSILVLDNFRKLKVTKGSSVNFSLTDVISAQNDEELGSLLLSKLEENGNPKEKLNFQNMKQLQGVLKGYFGIDVDDKYLIEPHKYTQIRHIVVHNQAFVDQRFINNLQAAGISAENYNLGSKVGVTRQDYRDCFAHLVLLFEQLDNEIERLKLDHIVS